MLTLHLDRICGIIHEAVMAVVEICLIGVFGWCTVVGLAAWLAPDIVRF